MANGLNPVRVRVSSIELLQLGADQPWAESPPPTGRLPVGSSSGRRSRCFGRQPDVAVLLFRALCVVSADPRARGPSAPGPAARGVNPAARCGSRWPIRCCS
ncbi:hypothetical protein QJS66_05190 [Kocuria rhizophila]|nr:hypothetical protein QJS66_05190 [Kocuria rhizophila]